MSQTLRNKYLPVTDEKSISIVNSILVELSQLVEHGLQMNDNTVSKHVLATRIQESARKEMECILDFINNDGVTSVRSSIETSADVIVLCKDVYKLPFSLVTPLRPENNSKLAVQTGWAT